MKQKELLLLVIPTFLFIIVWIVFTVVHSAHTSTISTAQNETISPITPSFDTATIALLKKRIAVEPLYALPERVAPAVTATPEASLSLPKTARTAPPITPIPTQILIQQISPPQGVTKP